MHVHTFVSVWSGCKRRGHDFTDPVFASLSEVHSWVLWGKLNQYYKSFAHVTAVSNTCTCLRLNIYTLPQATHSYWLYRTQAVTICLCLPLYTFPLSVCLITLLAYSNCTRSNTPSYNKTFTSFPAKSVIVLLVNITTTLSLHTSPYCAFGACPWICYTN